MHIGNPPGFRPVYGRDPKTGIWSIRDHTADTWWKTKPSSGYVTSGLVAYWDIQRQIYEQTALSSVLNLETTPADSSSQSAYDVGLGPGYGRAASTDLWSLKTDGTSYSAIASNTTFINSGHKDNAAFSGEIILRTPSTISGNAAIMGTTNTLSNPGWLWHFAAGGYPTVQISDGASGNALLVSAAAPVSVNTWYYLGFSIDEATGTGFFVRNGAYDPVTGPSDTFTATYTSPSASNSAQTFALLAMSTSGGTYLNSGAYVLLVRLYNVALTISDFAQNFANDGPRVGLV